MSATAFSDVGLRYLVRHGIEPEIAHEMGVREQRGTLEYPGGRRRPLDGDRTFQSKGQPLALWWPAGPPAAGADVLLCEGEPDALAALTALRSMNGAAPVSPPVVAALPGCETPVARVVEELRGAGSVTVCLDGDDAGRRAAERIVGGLLEAGVATSRIDPSDGQDLADLLCASADGGAALGQLLADAEAVVPATGEPSGDGGGTRGSSWRPVDLAPHLAGDAPVVRPALLARSDGQCLLYPGKLHWLSGEPEAGKGWIALQACAERMNAGERVLYVDFEDQAPTAIDRLRALGVADELIAERFLYLAPEGRVGDGDIDRLLALRPALAVADGVTEGMVLHGQDPIDNTAVAEWIGLVLRPFTRAGAAVLTLDHVTKSKDNRGRWAYGGQHKLAGVDVAYGVTVGVPMGRGRTGELHVVVHKDRPGFVRGFAHNGREAATVTIRSSGESVSVEVGSPGAAGGDEDFRPTGLMERVSKVLESGDGLTGEGIRAAVTGKAKWVDKARSLLVSEGRARVEEDGRSRLHFSVEPYRESEDPILSVPHGDASVPDEFVPPSRPALRGRPSRAGQDAPGTTPSRDLAGVDEALATPEQEAQLDRHRDALDVAGEGQEQ